MKVRLRQHFWDDALLQELAKGYIPRDFVEVGVSIYGTAYGVGGSHGTYAIPWINVGNPLVIKGAAQQGTIYLDDTATSGTDYNGAITKDNKKVFISPELYDNGAGMPNMGGDTHKAFPLKDMIDHGASSVPWDWNIEGANYNPISAAYKNTSTINTAATETIPVQIYRNQMSGPTTVYNPSGFLGYMGIPLTPALKESISGTSSYNKAAFVIQKAFFSTYRQRFIFVIATKDGKVYVIPSVWAKPVAIKGEKGYQQIYKDMPKYSTFRNLGNKPIDANITYDPDFVNEHDTKLEGQFVFDSLVEPVVEFDDLSAFSTVQIKTTGQSVVYKVEESDFVDERVVDISYLNSKTIHLIRSYSSSPSNVYGASVDWIGTSITNLMNKFTQCGANPVFISAHKSDPSQYEGVLIASDSTNWYIAEKGVSIDLSLTGTLFLDQFKKTPISSLAFDNYSHTAYTIQVRDIMALGSPMKFQSKPILTGIVGILPSDLFKFDGDVWDSAFGSAQSLGELIKENAAKKKEAELDPSHTGQNEGTGHPIDKPSTNAKSDADLVKIGIVIGAVFIGLTILKKS